MSNHDFGALVSIIVRTKDRPRLLKRALGSISAQTYRPIEVVLVNDGGCDLPEDELKEILRDVSINYVRLKENRGRAGAGNAGIENANGDYIGFLDDDDELYPEHISVLASCLKQTDFRVAYTDAEISYRYFKQKERKIVDVGKTILFSYKHFEQEEGKTADLNRHILFSKDFSYEELLVGNYIPFMCLLFVREAFTDSGGFDSNFILYEDWEFLVRIAEKYPFYHIKKTTAIYNQWDSDSQINQADPKQMRTMHLKVINKHREKITPALILDMRQKKEDFELKLQDLSAKYSSVNESIRERCRNISLLERAIRENEDRIWRLDEMVNEKDNHISKLELDIHLMRSTIGWKVLEKFRNIRGMFLPSSTGLGKIHALPLKSFKVLKNDGIKVFFNKVKYRLTSGSYDKKTEAPVLLPSDIESSALIHFPSKKNYNVLFLKCEWAGITNHYRVHNMVEYLKLKGINAEVMDLFDLPYKLSYAYKFDLVVIHRVPMTPSLNTFIKTCKEIKAIVIFDIDDYIFESSVIHQLEWVQHTKASEKDSLIEKIKQCRQTLEACDYFISPTDFLSDKVENLVEKSYVIRNGFSRELFQISLKVLEEKDPLKEDNIIRIGYFSGTNTHQRDFHLIAPAILKILKEYDYVNLYICGLLELDKEFDSFLHRVERSPFVPLNQLPSYISRADLNIAPLAKGDFFCESKSELKYVYAGALKISTVASSTDAFKFAIKHGENGFLASTEEEWYKCLKTLIEDSVLRKDMGEKAHAHVKKTYIPEVLAEKVKAVYEDIIDDVRAKNNILVNSASVNFIVSDVIENAGKYDSLFEIAEILMKNGHHVRLYFFKSIDTIQSDGFQKLPDDSKPFIIQGMENILPSDVLVCTDPRDSSVIAYQNRDKTANLVYLEMDENYEEIGYHWSELFKAVPYSLDNNEIANYIENIVWEVSDQKKS